MGYYEHMDDPNAPERHINIHFSPDIMAGVYANFANVSHSDYEFTITFARVDHEVEDDEIPGVVVSRVNLSAKFMRELIDAMQDNYSKWKTREDIKSLSEYDGTSDEPSEPAENPGTRPAKTRRRRAAMTRYGVLLPTFDPLRAGGDWPVAQAARTAEG